MRRLLFHAPAVGGHHSTFVRYLIEACDPGAQDLRVGFVVPSEVREQPELVDLARERGVELFLQEPERGPKRRLGPLLPWLQAKRVLPAFRATRVTFLYGDTILNSALPMQLPLGCPVSAIVFRSTAHYAACGFAALSPGEKLRARRQQLGLLLAERHRELAELFWLDPWGADHMHRMPRAAHFGHARPELHRWLPDPIELGAPHPERIAILRRQLAIHEGRAVHLLFGPPSERKGVEQTLAALLQLAAAERRRIHLLLVGKASSERRRALEPLVQQVTMALEGAFTWIDETVPEAAVPDYFALADVVLVPYQRHVGSSGVLLRAAGAGKPVIASDYGLVGAWTRQNALGCAVDCTSPEAIAEAIRTAQQHGLVGFHAATAAHFARSFTKQAFTRILLGQARQTGPSKPPATP